MVRISYTTAKKKYCEGAVITLVPSKANPHSTLAVRIQRSPKEPPEESFDKKVYDFSFRDCSKEVGWAVNFYMEDEDNEDESQGRTAG